MVSFVTEGKASPLERPAGNSQSRPAQCICDGDAGRHCRPRVVPHFYGRNRLHVVGPRRTEGSICRVASRESRPGRDREKICRLCVVRVWSWRPRMSTVRGVYAGRARGHLFSGVYGMALGNLRTPREASKALGDITRRWNVRAAAWTSPMSRLLGHWPRAAPAPRGDAAVGS